jgi:site-specific DNA-methyltransferase (adenine-specific)
MVKTKVVEPVFHLHRGDCVQLLASGALDKPQQRPNPGGPYDLVVADPPYSFGMEYDAYHDKHTYEEYLTWSKSWLGAVTAKLARHGSMFVFAPDEWVSEIDLHCRQELGLWLRNHIIWAFTFGVRCDKKFSRSHCHILYFTKTKSKFTFNMSDVAVPSARQLVYKDKRQRAGGKSPDAPWMLLHEQLLPHMSPDRDTWLVNRVCGTYKERQKHSPNQLPEEVVARIVRACSNPGDLVLDPFLGTGTTGVVCARFDRHFVGMDLSAQCVRESSRRIRACVGEDHGAESQVQVVESDHQEASRVKRRRPRA